MGQKVLELVQAQNREGLIELLTSSFPHWGEEFTAQTADTYLADTALQK